jgi:hypothetical protein
MAAWVRRSRCLAQTKAAIGCLPSPAKCWALLAVVAFATAIGLSQRGAGIAEPQQYAPAYYTGTQAEPTQLVVFPPGRPQVVIPLPVPSLLRSSVFAPDGRAIFATINTIKSPRTPGHPAQLGPPRLLRIDLSPVRVTTVADLVGLEDVFGLVMTLREDKLLHRRGMERLFGMRSFRN